MLFELLIIFAATILIWSLPHQSRIEALAKFDLVRLIDYHRDQGAPKELIWTQVGHPDAPQWETLGPDGIHYKVWFEQEVGWKVQKITDGLVTLEMTAVSESAAKGVAFLDRG